MTTTRTSVDHATHGSGKRNAERAGSSDAAFGDSRNRIDPEANDDPQNLTRVEQREKENKATREPAEG